MAYFSYRQYYPPLDSEVSHRPFSPRIKREEDEIISTHNHNGSGSNLPFVRPQVPTQGSSHYIPNHDEEYELEGTVPRPQVEPLEEIWKHEPRVTGGDRALSYEEGESEYRTHDVPSLPPVRTVSPPQAYMYDQRAPPA
jgi:diacylglycerol diphosphate phosphatase/phosphatidate phosphatase